MAKLPIRESRKGREGILVRAQEANGEIRWPTYRLHMCTHKHKHTHTLTQNDRKTDRGCHIKTPAQTHAEIGKYN